MLLSVMRQLTKRQNQQGGFEMSSLVRLAMIFGALLPATAIAQESRRPASRPPDSPATVTRKLRAEAAATDTGKNSRVFSALSEPRARSELKLSAPQIGMVTQLEKLTRDVIRAWLLRGLDATPPPPPDVLAERLSERGDRLRWRIVAHSEALVIQGILTPGQQQIFLKQTGRKPERLLPGRFGPQTMWIPGEERTSDDLAQLLRQTASEYVRAGHLFLAIMVSSRIREFIDPETNKVPPHLLRFARPYMPVVNLSKEESDLVNRLNSTALDIFRSWMTRDLDKTPLPANTLLRQRVMDHRRVEDSLFAHAEAILVEGILSPEHAEIALQSIWKEKGMRSLLDPALAARLRLSRSQREEVAFLLENKNAIYDRQMEDQSVRPVLIDDPESLIISEQIARAAREA